MDRRSPRSPILYERYKSGCAWGLISFLDFRQGHSNRKLISDRRRWNRKAVGNVHTRNKFNLPSNFDEKRQCITDGADNKSSTVGSGKAEVKKIKEEEMSTEQHITKKITVAKVRQAQFDSNLVDYLPKNLRKANKNLNKPCHICTDGCNDAATVEHGQPAHQNLFDKSSGKFESAEKAEAFFNQVHHKNGRECSCKNISCKKCGRHNEINLQVQMNGAAEAFTNQKSIDGKCIIRGGTSHQSKQFLDALEILNSNKEFFIKFLHDPNSLVLKPSQDLQDSQVKKQHTKSFSEAKLSEYRTSTNTRECEDSVCNRELMSFDGISPCSSSQSHYSLRTKGQSIKPSYFSFEHMKKKLRHAMRVSRNEQSWMSIDGTMHESPSDFKGSKDGGKERGSVIVGRNSTCKSDIDIGEMVKYSHDAKRRDEICLAKILESDRRHEAASTSESFPKIPSIVRICKESEFNIDIESRRRSSEMLNNGNEEFSIKQTPKSWGRMTSLPDYDFLPTLRYRRDGEPGSVPAQMRYSPYNYYPMVNENKWRVQKEKKNSCLSTPRQNSEAGPQADNKKPDDQLHISGNLFPDTKMPESICALHNDSGPRGFVKKTNITINPGEINPREVPFELDVTHNSGTKQSNDTSNTCKKNGYVGCSRVDLPLQNQTSPSSLHIYSSSPPSIQRVEDSDGMKDTAEHPSPVSVLERFLVEDIASPTSTISQSAEPPVQPSQINIEECCSSAPLRSPLHPKFNLSTSMDQHRFISEHGRAMLQASGFNWDEFSMMFHSSDQMFGPSLFDEVGLWHDQSNGDHRLFSDYMNEVLLEVHECYFRCSPWVSFLKPKIQPVPVANNIVLEVMKRVDQHLLSKLPSQAPDQLIERDLAKSGMWMDIRFDTEEFVLEMVDDVLDELIMQTADELQI